MYTQTLCFIRRGDELLMLNRNHKPTQGLWNGVGGKIEEGETAKDCIVREIQEETNIVVQPADVIDRGMITWETDGSYADGLYVYRVDMHNTFDYETPRKTSEGILDWKKISWLMEEGNLGVGEMLPRYLSEVLHGEGTPRHFCTLKNKRLVSYEMK